VTPQGILNVDKPEGITSFGVVARVRNGSGVKKVGHAGTLDPSATGVLLVCVGQAARVSEFMMELPKTYRGSVRLGIATDTYDAEGEVVFEGDGESVDEARLREALSELAGRDRQVPPSFSALKVGGTPAHRLARAGRPVALKERKTRIDSIELLGFDPPMVELEVRCGKGTYIRTLADDLGRLLGCGAHLRSLRRTAIGPFEVEDALTLDRLATAFEDDTWRDLLLPTDYGLGHLPAAHLEMEAEKDVRHGVALAAELAAFRDLAAAENGALCRAYAEDGSFIGILRYDIETKSWNPRKVFISGHPMA
jgi:tRNA pseudouridine55 synthase